MEGPAGEGHADGGKHQIEMSKLLDGRRLRQAQVETEGLMPGEDPFTIDVADAQHWIKVYSELYDFTVGVLERFHAEMLDQPAEDTGWSDDALRIYERQIQRFAGRLVFWNRRRSQLQAGSGL